MRTDSTTSETQVKELMDAVEKALNCIDDCCQLTQNLHECLIDIPDEYRTAIEQGGFTVRSREELLQFNQILQETLCYIETMNKVQVIYGPPPAFDKINY